jgi:chromosome segregation ATPase
MPSILDKTKSLLTGDDAERLGQRRSVKKEIASLEAEREGHRAITSQLRQLAEREEKSTEDHEKICTPQQKRIAEIESEIAGLIFDNEPIPDKLAAQRAKCYEKIATANAKLEAEVEAIKSIRKGLQSQAAGHNTLDSEITRLRGMLKSKKLANPELQLHLFVINQEFHFANERCRVAERERQQAWDSVSVQQREREKLEKFHTNSHGEIRNLPGDDVMPKLQQAAAEWESEFDAAEQARYEADRRRREIRQKMEDE